MARNYKHIYIYISEDEAVPRNIKIARNLLKTQTDMVKQVGKHGVKETTRLAIG